MGCGSCSSGGGTPAGCGSNGSCVTGSCGKLEVFDWLSGMELPNGQNQFDIIEVKFKNTRKEFIRNSKQLELSYGEPVVVEAASGYDIGTVSLTGELVRIQMQKKGIKPDSRDVKNVIRKPSQADLDKWTEAQKEERPTMLRSRSIAKELKLQMKISDVEYQADRSKATFFYTADDRVDFRELIKILADQFKLRIEMRQIGARQEAGRLGGIGSCGRELCCSTWLTDFRSVSTNAARYQQLSINPMKLAGQCGKLKCCLNYELDAYLDALKDFPSTETKLETQRGLAEHQKSDIFKGIMWYNYPDDPGKFYCLTKERVKEIIQLNKKGEKPADLTDFELVVEEKTSEVDYANVVGQDSLTRFDKNKKRGGKNRRKKGNRKGGKPQQKAKGNPKQNKGGNKPPENRKKGGKKPYNKGRGNNPKGKSRNNKPNGENKK
ncbi:PSP1 domain-containing protein [Salibacter halophilus]|jgi:cell fate regulator YaaT (PSP1 superfamily)|uniref:PSP1 C-terminal domain-containing protein n=1 Tax=Salibacter halophilus TaxID=1803916 RepID=A0A6N6M5Y3_9FLAO|nr:regulatory iron-sulfur-containing complex subunit RicT [Salibacter halophilus]KAB1063710.1 hypothetical protein F3059_09075 [Salibacter halophilus]